ncbi:MAG: CC/Se motif family (seleno)protein [Dissulfurispiraceae bacterium]
MLTITPEALSVIIKHNKPIFLELPKLIRNCCFDLQECPSVRIGEPGNTRDYDKKIVQEVTVFLPWRLQDHALTITVSNFFGRKRLVVDGWRFF